MLPTRLFIAALAAAFALTAERADAQPREVVIGSIDFEGNKNFKDDRLLRLLPIKEDSEYETAEFDSAAFEYHFKKIAAFYASEGFRGCASGGVELDYNGDSTEADLTVKIIEGAPTLIDTLVVAGNTFFTTEELLGKLDFARGDRYERQAATAGRTAIGTAYKTAGFLDARVEVAAEWGGSADRCSLAYTIDEGVRFSVDSVSIEGLETVKPRLVTREFRFTPGEYVDLDALAATQRLLYETNLFRTASVKPVPAADSASPKKDIQVRLMEEDPGKLELTFGFGTIDKVRGGALFTYNNTFGEGYRSSIGGKFSAIEQTIATSLDNPRMFETTWGTSVVGTVSREDEPSYIIEYVNGSLNFYKKFLRRSRFSLTPSYEIGRYTELRFGLLANDESYQGLPPEEIAEIEAFLRDLRVGYDRWGFKGSLQFDVRDNLLAPAAGVYVDLSSEFIYGTLDITYQDVPLLPSTNRLVSSEAIVRAYHAIDRSTTIATSIETGLIIDLGASGVNFLIDDLFYAGGPTSLRGFDYKAVGPVSNGTPVGGRLKLVWNAFEVRRKLVGIFGAVAFFDIGNVWLQPEYFTWEQFRYSPGAGLRLDSPIGVVRFDVGFNPWPLNGEASQQWWIGIGHAF